MIIAFGSQGQHSRVANCYSRESRLFNLTCFRVLRAEWLHLTSIPGLASSAGSGNTKLDKTRNIFTASESQMAVCCFAMRANCENNHDFRAHLRNSFFTIKKEIVSRASHWDTFLKQTQTSFNHEFKVHSVTRWKILSQSERHTVFRFGGSVFQWHPELKIGFAHTCTLLHPVSLPITDSLLYLQDFGPFLT